MQATNVWANVLRYSALAMLKIFILIRIQQRWEKKYTKNMFLQNKYLQKH